MPCVAAFITLLFYDDALRYLITTMTPCSCKRVLKIRLIADALFLPSRRFSSAFALSGRWLGLLRCHTMLLDSARLISTIFQPDKNLFTHVSPAVFIHKMLLLPQKYGRGSQLFLAASLFRRRAASTANALPVSSFSPSRKCSS